MQAKPLLSWRKGDVGVSRGYTDYHQGRGHSIRPTAALINIHEHLIRGIVSTSCHQLTSDHKPVCMCHCIVFRINPHVIKYHAFIMHRVTVHTTDLLSNFRCQHVNENLRSFIHQYTKMHWQVTGLKPENDYDLSRKVEFMKRIRNTQIVNKIIKSNHFKDYTRYSLQACFARALELEGDFQVGEVVTPNYTQA